MQPRSDSIMSPEQIASIPPQGDAQREEDLHKRMAAFFEGGHERVAAGLKLAFAHLGPISAAAAAEGPTAYTIRAMRRKSSPAIEMRSLPQYARDATIGPPRFEDRLPAGAKS
jgi:hypothetical protein